MWPYDHFSFDLIKSFETSPGIHLNRKMTAKNRIQIEKERIECGADKDRKRSEQLKKTTDECKLYLEVNLN